MDRYWSYMKGQCSSSHWDIHSSSSVTCTDMSAMLPASSHSVPPSLRSVWTWQTGGPQRLPCRTSAPSIFWWIMLPVPVCSRSWTSHRTSLTSKTVSGILSWFPDRKLQAATCHHVQHIRLRLYCLSSGNLFCLLCSFISRSFNVNVKAVLHVSQVQ